MQRQYIKQIVINSVILLLFAKLIDIVEFLKIRIVWHSNIKDKFDCLSVQIRFLFNELISKLKCQMRTLKFSCFVCLESQNMTNVLNVSISCWLDTHICAHYINSNFRLPTLPILRCNIYFSPTLYRGTKSVFLESG